MRQFPPLEHWHVTPNHTIANPFGTNPIEIESEEAIFFAHEKKWLNDWERAFYLDTFRKRKLSEKQENCRVKINDRILSKLRITAKNANTE